MRDVNAFRERYNYWKSTGELPYEAGIPTYAGGKKPTPSAKDIYNRLLDLGFDRNSALGILGNAMQESSMNPDSIAPGKNYHGLLQNSTAIRDAVVSLYGDHSLKNQLQYVSDWADNKSIVRTKKYGDTTGTYAGRYKKSGYKTPEEAAYQFMKLYERPVLLDEAGKIKGYQHQKERVNYATRLANQIKDMNMSILYPERVGNNYDYDRANELGYTRGEDGHFPSRDYKTGRILKSPSHPTMPVTLLNDMRMGYYPVEEQPGVIYTKTWEPNEMLQDLLQFSKQPSITPFKPTDYGQP